MKSFVFELTDLQTKQIASSGIEVKLKCPDTALDIDLDTNDIRFSIPRFKEEMLVDLKFTPISNMMEETHYKARHDTEEFHPSCWYKSKMNIAIHSKPLKHISTFYLIPKDDTCISEVEFWMTGKQRRQSSKEDYFHRKVSEQEMTHLEKLGVI